MPFQVNDRVRVIGGKLKGHVGVIGQDANDAYVWVRFEGMSNRYVRNTDLELNQPCEICEASSQKKDPANYHLRTCTCGSKMMDHPWAFMQHPHIAWDNACRGFTETIDESFED